MGMKERRKDFRHVRERLRGKAHRQSFTDRFWNIKKRDFSSLIRLR